MANTPSITAYRTFVRPYFPLDSTGYGGDGNVTTTQVTGRVKDYNLLWHYYNNSLFEELEGFRGYWAAYKRKYTLYRQIRALFNPVPRLVEFYVSTIYPGILTEDGQPLPKEMAQARLAIPFSQDTAPKLTEAIAQVWRWTNFQSQKSVIPRYCAALGDVLVEVIDDVERKKVYFQIVPPTELTNLEVDQAGNVVAYTIQRQVQEVISTNPLANANSKKYKYVREVTKTSVKVTHDDKVVADESGAHPYGFCPAVWIRQKASGSIYGVPAMGGTASKIDQLNSTASQTFDQIAKKIGAPKIFWTSADITNLVDSIKRPSSELLTNSKEERETMLLWRGPADGRVDSLAADMNIADGFVAIDRLLAEIKDDFPECNYYQSLRQMTQVSGVALSRMMGDVEQKVSEVAANYDQQLTKLFQMAVAIAGYRANDGDGQGWGELTDAQKKFTDFDLESYDEGKLELTILPRPLITPNETEQLQQEQLYWQVVAQKQLLGIPLSFTLAQDGWTEEQLQELQDAKDKVAQAQADMLATQQQQQGLGQNETEDVGSNQQQPDDDKQVSKRST